MLFLTPVLCAALTGGNGVAAGKIWGSAGNPQCEAEAAEARYGFFSANCPFLT